MRLSLQMRGWVIAHACMGLVQLAGLYLIGSTASYGGEAGFLAYTPVGSFFGAERGRLVEGLDLPGLFQHLIHVGDVIWGLAAFEYDVLDIFDSSDGVVYWIVIIFQVAAWLGSAAAGEAVAEKIFQSGVLQSTVGSALVLGGVGIVGVLGALGIAN